MDTKKLRQKILDLAIHGKLVSQDPNDEPASVLLERIRAEKERLIAEGKIKRSKKSATSDTSHYENVPFEVPDGWCWCQLEDYFELLSGQDFPPEKYNDAQKGIPYIIGASNINNEKIVINRWTQTPSVKTTKGDLLVVCKGAGVGKMALNDIGEMHIARQIQAIRDVSQLMSIEYIKMVVSYYIEDIIADANGLIPGLKRELLLSLLMPIPPLQEQKRIIATYEQLMSFIENIDNESSEVLHTIRIAKSKILDLAIHGKLVPQNASDEPASELLKRINPKAIASCDNPHYANIPSSWVCTTMGSIFQHNTGKALNKSASTEGALLPYLTTSNVYWNTFDLSVVKEMRFKESEIDKCTIRKGDLLVCEGGDIGRAAIWDKDYSICIQNHLHRLRPKGEVLPLLYLYYIMYLKLTNNLEGKGIGLQGFSSGLLDKLEVPLPPYNEQIRIVDKIQETFNMLDSIAESLN